MKPTRAHIKNHLIVSACLSAAAFLLWCFFFQEPLPVGVTPKIRQLLGNRSVTILAASQSVEVFKVSSRVNSGKTIGGYRIEQVGKTQGKHFAKQLSATLFAIPDSITDYGKACNFAPAVGFRVWSGKQPNIGLRISKGNEKVDLLLCFHCDEFMLIGKRVWGPIQMSHEVIEDIPDRGALLRLVKIAFPDDEQIQSLH